MYYLDEYDINLSIEQALAQYQYSETEPPPPKIPKGNFKRNLPVYLFLIAFGIITVVSLILLNHLSWP
jgi:hypothetical protein